MRIQPLILLLLLSLFSCTEQKKDIAFLDRKVSDQEKIKWLLNKDNATVLELDEAGIEFLQKFYKNRKYKSLWGNDSLFNAQGKILNNVLHKPISLGIPDKRINLKAWNKKHLLINELLLTHALAHLKADLHSGLLDTVSKTLKPLSYSDLNSFKNDIRFEKKEDAIVRKIISWGSSDTVYQKLAVKLYEFTKYRPLNDQNLKVPLEKKDSLKAHELTKKSLLQKGYLKQTQVDSTTFYTALGAFQLENGLKNDGVIGQFTVDALNETNLEKCQRTALALEKLRWRKRAMKRYITINIPEFTLRLYMDDTLKNVHRVVVGKFDTQTPEFSAELRTIVAYPFWTVPFSITSKEILPDAKRNPGYFAKNNMKLYKKNEEIDPYSVNWKGIRNKTFPFKVVQQPGSHNSLGIIKFEFSNPYGVYVHDTPSKSLFNTVIRSYSHGCIRCEKPLDLAKTILIKDENKVIPDSLDSIMLRVDNHPIQLKKRIPIFIEYISVVVDRDYHLIFLRDIYLRDRRLAKMMFS